MSAEIVDFDQLKMNKLYKELNELNKQLYVLWEQDDLIKNAIDKINKDRQIVLNELKKLPLYPIETDDKTIT